MQSSLPHRVAGWCKHLAACLFSVVPDGANGLREHQCGKSIIYRRGSNFKPFVSACLVLQVRGTLPGHGPDGLHSVGGVDSDRLFAVIL